ncbi:MAG TPA: cysteine desulfurase family protein [Verrucomicrobiae bacterium]|nr:cysteine desulfurase family protein [Verrucomicrobiae bacterium]
MRRVFLDHQSATPVLPEVVEAMRPFFAEAFGSPASLHQLGLRARDALAKAREQSAALINAASPEEIIFTSGGTESANLAVKGTAFANQRRGNHIVVTEIEHPSVLNSVEFLGKHGFNCTKVGVDADGRVDPEEVKAAINDRTILLCVHHVNHDIGTLEPIPEVSAIAAEKGIPLFVDAVAGGGWLPIDVRALGIDLLSLTPHRFYGPKGVGVLYRNRRVRLTSLIHGGVQEGGLRAGTENVPAIVGAGVAAEVAAREMPRRMARVAELQRRLWNGIRTGVTHVKLNGPEPGQKRISTNLNISVEFIEGEGLALMLDVNGIAAASGPSCISKSLKIPPVLAAIGLNHRLAQGSIILSLGKDNTEEEIDYVIETFTKIVTKLRAMSPTWDEFQRGSIDSATGPGRRGRTAPAGASGRRRRA